MALLQIFKPFVSKAISLTTDVLLFQELFQGKTKDFNVQKALSASSLRDFDEAISMVSHGFDTLDVFYSATSTRQLITRMKIPLLFIQV